MKRLAELIRDVLDFPEPGIVFKDITPLLADHDGLRLVVDTLADSYREAQPTLVVGIESRGFILAAPIALQLGAGFIPIRKPGKLPYEVISAEYELEYGTDAIEMHIDAVAPGERVLIVDDVLATGGTAAAAARLVEQAGATVVGIGVMVELLFLDGRSKLEGHDLVSLVQYES